MFGLPEHPGIADRETPGTGDEQQQVCYLMTAEQHEQIGRTLVVLRGELKERQSLLADILVAAEGTRLPEHIVDHLKWEGFVRENANFPWSVPSGYDPVEGMAVQQSVAAREPRSFRLAPEQVQAYNRNLAALRARLIELDSLLEKTAAAIPGVQSPVRTLSRLRRVLEEDRLTDAEPPA